MSFLLILGILISSRVNLGNAVNLAAYSSCRQFLEQKGKEFCDRHFNDYEPNNKCSERLVPTMTTTALLRHFEQCVAVTSDSAVLFGDELTAELEKLDIQAPSQGNFAGLWGTLSDSIHNCSWFKDSTGAIIVPNDLEDFEKRFLVRYLRATDHSVVIANSDGSVRDPLPHEVVTPDKAKKG